MGKNRSGEVVLILHNVRSAHNVGSILRTAEGAGVSKVYLTGYTPALTDRFGRMRMDIAKASLGAEHLMVVEHVANVSPLINQLKQEGFHMVAVEQDSRARSFKIFTPRAKTVYLFGNEVRGISKALRNQADAIIDIPMRGKKESLNVSVAVGVILFNAR